MIRSATRPGSSLMGRWPQPGSAADRAPGGSSPRLRDWCLSSTKSREPNATVTGAVTSRAPCRRRRAVALSVASKPGQVPSACTAERACASQAAARDGRTSGRAPERARGGWRRSWTAPAWHVWPASGTAAGSPCSTTGCLLARGRPVTAGSPTGPGGSWPVPWPPSRQRVPRQMRPVDPQFGQHARDGRGQLGWARFGTGWQRQGRAEAWHVDSDDVEPLREEAGMSAPQAAREEPSPCSRTSGSP